MSFAPAAPRRLMWSPPAPSPAGGSGVVIALATAMSGFWARAGRTAAARRAETTSGFDQLVLVHLDAAYSLARYLARDPEAAEDIVQEAVLKAHRAFGGYRGGEAKAWLLTIVRREFIDWSNARRAGRAVFSDVEPDELEQTAPAEAENAEDALVRQGEVGAVRRAIEALPEPFRESIVLRELEELSYRQVAEITGVPIGTVMSRLARGREMLARKLEVRP